MSKLCSRYSKRFGVTIDYYPEDISSFENGHIKIVWGCSVDDGRAYYLVFVDDVFDDSMTEVA